ESVPSALRDRIVSEQPVPNDQPGRDRLSLTADPQPPTPLILHFAVSDTGPGIHPAELETLFDLFVQTESGRRSQQGTGLGLAISRKFIRLMGGDIRVHSTIAQGTTFDFTLPVQVVAVDLPQPQPQPQPQIARLAPNQRSPKILVAEDHPANRSIVVQLLTQVGFDVREAEDGTGAIDLARQWQPDLILMDMQMPNVDGYEATRQIKAIVPAPVVIALTASAFREQWQQMQAVGCEDCISKPFQMEDLLKTIAAYLDVCYVYRDAPAPPQRERIPLRSSDLAVLPTIWRKSFQQSASRLDTQQCYQLIRQIAGEHQEIAMRLRLLVDDFRFDTLLELLAGRSIDADR
ncbi:MAG: response regulator, partial [Leptolyngbyaceae cyanobacterium SM1_3_5]|nr:response regulator [Leptolyngbyaceae cyanobacterium SM1_3_5]